MCSISKMLCILELFKCVVWSKDLTFTPKIDNNEDPLWVSENDTVNNELCSARSGEALPAWVKPCLWPGLLKQEVKQLSSYKNWVWFWNLGAQSETVKLSTSWSFPHKTFCMVAFLFVASILMK